MESISKATTDLGLIAFSLVREDRTLIAEDGQAVKVFASSAEDLLEVLETLDSLPLNPVVDLPRGFEKAAEDCAAGVSKMRQDMARNVHGRELSLKPRDAKSRESTLRSYTRSLKCYLERLSRSTAAAESLGTVHSRVLSTLLENEGTDEIDITRPPPEHLNTLAKDLIRRRISFSGPQRFQLLKLLEEFEEFHHLDEVAGFSTGTWADFRRGMGALKRRLCWTALSDYEDEPIPEALEAIGTLQAVVIAMRSATRPKPAEGQPGVRRKAIDGMARRVRVYPNGQRVNRKKTPRWKLAMKSPPNAFENTDRRLRIFNR